MALSDRGFGPNALLTPANAITLARLAATPVLLAQIAETGSSWATLGFWILLAGSDGVDGWLARKQGTTRSGAFLDPLADKFLVLGALIVLVAEGKFWWLPVALISFREISLTLYRSWLGKRGISLPARWSAKVKTVVQEVAVGFALLPLTDDHDWVGTSVLWIAGALTLFSGIQYLMDARRHTSEL